MRTAEAAKIREMRAIEAEQSVKVNAAYAVTGGLNPDYEREFDILSDMRRAHMGEQFRMERGLPPDAKTPYDQTH
jgi:hypothetical protein